MARGAFAFEVDVLADQLLVDEETLVIFFRLDRRRRPCSPLALAAMYLGGLAELLQDAFAGVAGYTAALGCRCRVSIQGQQQDRNGKQTQFPHIPPPG